MNFDVLDYNFFLSALFIESNIMNERSASDQRGRRICLHFILKEGNVKSRKAHISLQI